MNIKAFGRLFFLVFFLLCFLPKGYSLNDTSFVLHGNIKGYGDGQAVMSYYNPNKRIEPDTISIKNDRFVFKGKLDAPMIVFARILNNGKLGRDFSTYSILLENANVTLDGDVKDMKNYTSSGSWNDKLLRQIRQDSKDLLQEFLEVEKKYKDLKDTTAKKQLKDEMEKKKWRFFDYLLNYEDFYNSYAGTFLLWVFSDKRIPWQQMDSILPHFSESVHNSVYYQHMARKVDAVKRIQPGRKASDFIVKDLKGQSYTMKNFSGNYLLMTFSASWCAPCKLEYPYLRKAYDQYAGKGLKMIIMNVDDSREEWAGDVKKYGFPFPVLSDLNAFSGPLTKNYGVLSIPKIFLIDPDGMIVSSTIRQQAILDKLKEIYP